MIEKIPEDCKVQYINLKELFDNNACFKIPSYQRGYSWEESQVSDFIYDIEELMKSDYDHFTGTVVATKKQDKNVEYWEIIDGQQRITTLVIFIASIHHFINKEKIDFHNDHDLLKNYVIAGDIGNQRQKLELNAETNSFFKDIIIEDNKISDKEILSHKNLQKAKEKFDAWLKDNNTNITKIVDVITKRLKFIFFTPKDAKNVGVMFEVINNRGKPLSELEKIKNYLIYLTSVNGWEELREAINGCWGEILKNLNQARVEKKEDENSFLRFCYLVFFNNDKSKSWHVYRELKNKDFSLNKCKEDKVSVAKKIKCFLDFLREASKNYAFFFNHDYFNSKYNGENKKELCCILEKLYCHSANASIMPLYLSIMSKNEKRIDLLTILEKLNFRVYCLPNIVNRTDSGQGELFHFAKQYYYNNEFKDEKDNNTTLAHVLTQYTKKIAPLERSIDSLSDKEVNYYKWRDLKYFLACYEYSLRKTPDKKVNVEAFDITKITRSRSETDSGDYVSVEHIWAEQNMIDKFSKDCHEKTRLGNFALMELSENIKNSKDDIPQKINRMFEAGDKSRFIQVNELKKYLEEAEKKLNEKKNTEDYYKDLSEEISKNRENNFKEFFKNNWALDDDEVKKINVTSS